MYMTSLLHEEGKSSSSSEDELKRSGLWSAIQAWGVAYHGLSLQQDVQGGCLLALVVLMQGVASAAIAQVSVVSGPYAGVVPPLVYGILGTSRHLSVGTGAIIALVVAEQVQDAGDEEARTKAAVALTFMLAD